MPDIIELRAKTNKDLLIMTVMQGNECVRHLKTLNSTVEKHEKRLAAVESSVLCMTNHGVNIGWSKKKTFGVGSGIFLFGSFAAGVAQYIFENML